MIDLDELETLAKDAGGLPWAEDGYIIFEDIPGGGDVVGRVSIANAICGEVADFMASANPATILELIAEVRRLREDLQASRLLAHANAEMFKAEKADGERVKVEIVGALTDAGVCMLAENPTARGEIASAVRWLKNNAGNPLLTPAEQFAIVVDRTYEGEGISLAVWNGENYNFPDGDCYDRDGDTLDGYTAEWLTDYQVQQLVIAARAKDQP